jgi:hypothetical protein
LIFSAQWLKKYKVKWLYVDILGTLVPKKVKGTVALVEFQCTEVLDVGSPLVVALYKIQEPGGVQCQCIVNLLERPEPVLSEMSRSPDKHIF